MDGELTSDTKQNLVKKLQEIESFGCDRDDNSGSALVSGDIIDKAYKIIDIGGEEDLLPFEVSVLPIGGIGMVWVRDDAEILLEITPDRGYYFFYRSKINGNTRVHHYEFLPANVKDILTYWIRYLVI